MSLYWATENVVFSTPTRRIVFHNDLVSTVTTPVLSLSHSKIRNRQSKEGALTFLSNYKSDFAFTMYPELIRIL